MSSLTRAIPFAAAVFAAGAMLASAHAQQSITVASWGGVFQEAESKAFFQPAAKMLGITIKEDTTNGLADVRLQVNARAVNWDIAELGAEECARGTKEGLFEKLDYSVIDASGIDKRLVHDDWVGAIYYSDVIAWNTEKFGKDGPKTWADFWNVEKFPGSRALGNFATETLTIAALADGVPPDQVYPLDIDRAFKSLEKIKPHVTVWWTSGAQAMQLIKDGEVDMTSIWNGRITTIIADGAKADFTFNQGVFNADCWVIPKGAPNKDLAMKALALFLSPELQANLPKYISNGPVNMKAFETGKLSPEEAKQIVSSPENAAKQVLLDFQWWGENLVEVQERWDAFLAE